MNGDNVIPIRSGSSPPTSAPPPTKPPKRRRNSLNRAQLTERIKDQQQRLYLLQNLLSMTRARLIDIVDNACSHPQAVEDCGGTVEICGEMVDAIVDALDPENLYSTEKEAPQ